MANTNHTRPIPEELLSAYIDDQVTEQERRQVEALLAENPAAAQSLAELRHVASLMSRVPRQPVPRAFTLDESTVQPQASQPRRNWLAWLKPLYLRGAAALVAVCLVVLMVGDLGTRVQLVPVAQQPAISQTETGGLAAEDGDPTSIIAKAPTTDPDAQDAAGFLHLAPGVLLALEAALALLLVVLLVAAWQLSRVT